MPDPVAHPFDLWSEPGDADHVVGRISTAWRDEILRDCNLARAYMVVELVLGNGKRFRMATENLSSLNTFDEEKDPQGVLVSEASVENTYDIASATSSARGLQFVCPAWFIDPQTQIRDGAPLSGFGEVSLLAPGMAWEDRRVILRGDMAGGVTFGAVRPDGRTRWRSTSRGEAETFTTTLQDPRESANPVFPAWVADEEAWPDVHPNSVGKPYPVVLGRYIIEALRVSQSTSTPQFLVCYGHDVDVDTVWRNDDNETVNFTTLQGYDANGVPVTLVTAGVFATWEDSDTVTVEVSPTSGTNPDLMDAIEDLLLTFHPAGQEIINDQLFGDARAKMEIPRRVSILCNSRTTLINFIEDGVLDDFPMFSMVWRNGRYGPVLTDWRAEPRMLLEVGTTLLRSRLGEVAESPKGEVFNRYQIRYDLDIRIDEYTKTLEFGPENNNACALSESTEGDRVAPILEAAYVKADATASWIVDWQTAHLTLPTYFVSYAGAACLFWMLREGDTVTLTDGDLQWYGVRATVESIAYQRGLSTIGLRVWQSPVRAGKWPTA